MSTELEAIKPYIGTVSGPVIYQIDAGSIKFFAESLLDPDPRYYDEKAAGGTVVAPPTFYGSATGVRNMKSDDPRTVSATSVPMPRGWVGFNAGDDFEFLEPIQPGDILTCREKVIDAYEKQGRSGHLIFVVREKTFTNQAGKVALIRRATSVSRPVRLEEANPG